MDSFLRTFCCCFRGFSAVSTSRFCQITCAGPIMKNLIFIAAIMTCVAVTAFAQPAWQFVSKQMLAASGLSVNADRFEVVSADRCEAFELRIWARIFDKNSNLLAADDYVDLQLSLAEMQIAQGGRVIDIAKDFSDEFDVVYLSFGYWDWEMMSLFNGYENEAITVIFEDDRAEIEANGWIVGNLPETLGRLRSSCATLFEGDLT
jgi:hypothetical protein